MSRFGDGQTKNPKSISRQFWRKIEKNERILLTFFTLEERERNDPQEDAWDLARNGPFHELFSFLSCDLSKLEISCEIRTPISRDILILGFNYKNITLSFSSINVWKIKETNHFMRVS